METLRESRVKGLGSGPVNSGLLWRTLVCDRGEMSVASRGAFHRQGAIETESDRN